MPSPTFDHSSRRVFDQRHLLGTREHQRFLELHVFREAVEQRAVVAVVLNPVSLELQIRLVEPINLDWKGVDEPGLTLLLVAGDDRLPPSSSSGMAAPRLGMPDSAAALARREHVCRARSLSTDARESDPIGKVP